MTGAALRGPRTIAIAPSGDLYVALREGNAIYRIDPTARRITHLAGTGEKGYTGDGGPARAATLAGPKGLAYDASGKLYIADTENHAIRVVDLASGVITTVLGTGTLTTSGGTTSSTLTTSSLALGAHTITAVYSGDGNDQTSTSTALGVTIGQDSTTTTVSASPSNSSPSRPTTPPSAMPSAGPKTWAST